MYAAFLFVVLGGQLGSPLVMPIGDRVPVINVEKTCKDTTEADMGDVEATIFIARLVKERASEIWDALMPLAAKPAVIERALSSNILSLTEYFMGKPHSWLVVGCGQNPEYDVQLGVFDLRYDPANILICPSNSSSKL